MASISSLDTGVRGGCSEAFPPRVVEAFEPENKVWTLFPAKGAAVWDSEPAVVNYKFYCFKDKNKLWSIKNTIVSKQNILSNKRTSKKL